MRGGRTRAETRSFTAAGLSQSTNRPRPYCRLASVTALFDIQR